MADLQALNIGGTQVRDIAPLAALTGLRSLNLQFLPVGDLGPLASLANLRNLNLGGTEVQDLTPLAGLTQLRDLYLAVTKVRALGPLGSLRQLTALNLDSTRVNDLRPLAGNDALRFLSLNGTPVSDVQPLAGMVNLRRLDLGGTQVSDIRPLSRLRDLRVLNLEGTFVADVTALAGLTELGTLSLAGSLVRDPRASVRPGSPVGTVTAGPVLFWIDQTNLAIQADGTNPFMASRVLALESIAVLDTIRSLNGTPAYLVRLPAPRGLTASIAVTAAAHRILSHAFPARQKVLDVALAAILADEASGPARSQALAFGRAVADGVIAIRGGDGWNATGAALRAGTAPGQWRPTPPDFLPPIEVQWASLKPFALIGPAQFRPSGPPPIESATFWEAKMTLTSLGAARSSARTPDQTEIAYFWADGPGTLTPPGALECDRGGNRRAASPWDEHRGRDVRGTQCRDS